MRSTQIAYVMCSVRFASHSEAPYTVATSALGTDGSRIPTTLIIRWLHQPLPSTLEGALMRSEGP